MADNSAKAITDRRAQAAMGLLLAALVIGVLAFLHAYSMFVFQLSWGNAGAALMLAAAQCWLFVGLFIVAHDAMHGSLVPGRAGVNAGIGAAALFLYAGFSWRKLRAAHFDHHRFVGTERDPDFSADHPTRFWPWYGQFMTRYFGWGSALFVSAVVTLYWLVLDVPLAKILLFYAVPAIASSAQLFYFGTYRPHRHGAGGFADRHNARSDGFSTLASLATCFHFGYHHEHHLHPQVPWWKLPALRRSRAGDNAGKEAGA